MYENRIDNPLAEEIKYTEEQPFGRFAVTPQNREVSPGKKKGHTTDTRRHHKSSTKKSDKGKACGKDGRTGRSYKQTKMNRGM